MNPPETEEPNPFAGLSAAEVFGFVHRKEGEDGLRELLGMFGDLTSEFLEEAASELEAAGMSKPAALVRTFANDVPSELDSGNPYDESDYINWAEWRNSWLRRRKMAAGGIEEAKTTKS
jgi:hypothetical protein